MNAKLNSNKFSSAKEKYYKNIKNLLEKINSDLNIKEEKENMQENIIEINPNPKPKSDNKNSEIEICQKCNTNPFKYTCPKCKLKYCNVECYKFHNLDCTEDFYKRNVLEELKSTKTNEEESTKFRKNLKDYFDKINTHQEANFENELSNRISEEREKHFENILNKIEMGSFDFNTDLTHNDWEEFNKFLNGFGFGNINNNENNKNGDGYFLPIEIWKPFWESKVSDFEPSLDVFDLNLFKNYDEKTFQNLKEIEINDKKYNEYYKKLNGQEENINNPSDTTDENENENENEIGTLEELLEQKLDEMTINNQNEKNQNGFNDIEHKLKMGKRELIYKSILLKYKDIPHLARLSKIKPSPLNFFAISNILLHTVFLFRLYNGEVNENLEEISDFIFENCKVLFDKEIVFESLRNSIDSFFNENCDGSSIKIFLSGGSSSSSNSNSYLNSNDNKNCNTGINCDNNYKHSVKLILNDLKQILKNKFYIFESFIRLYEILHKIKSTKKSEKKIILSKHKIIYFLSYIKDLDQNLLEENFEEVVNIYKEK